MGHPSDQGAPVVPGTDGHASVEAAVEVARAAPSVHNTQPWRWRLGDRRLELRADRRRQLPVEDPDGRLLTQSCGTALHHARVALAAAGWRLAVDRFPDPADADLLASLRLDGPGNADPHASDLLAAARQRRTDRRPVTAHPVEPHVVDALSEAVEGEGAYLYVIPPRDIGALNAAMAQADEAEVDDQAHRAEIAAWIGGERPEGMGVPADAIPDRPQQMPVVSRYFGPPRTLPTDGAPHSGAIVAIPARPDRRSPRHGYGQGRRCRRVG